MKIFTKLNSDFWINYENSKLISLGADAQLMALYLVGNSHHNMLGIYYLPIAYIANDMKLSPRKVKVAIQKLCDINYCVYDCQTQYVWVCDMVKMQLGDNIEAKDNRTKSLQAIWKESPSYVPFLNEFYQKYKDVLGLGNQEGKNVFKNNGLSNDLIPLRRGYEGVSKGLRSKKEVRSKKIEDKSKKEKERTEKEEEKQSTELIPNIVEADYASATSSSSDDGDFSLDLSIDQIFDESPEILASSEGNSISGAPGSESQREKSVAADSLKSCMSSASDAEHVTALLPESQAELPMSPDESHNPNRSKSRSELSVPPNSQEQIKVSSELFHSFTPNSPSEVIAIFAHWKKTMHHPNAILDDKRKTLIRKALKLGYSVSDICNAITGCSLTPHNIGQNERGQRYDGLHIILRDADQIDRFMQNYRTPPQAFNKAHQRLHSNLQAAKAWLKGDYANILNC